MAPLLFKQMASNLFRQLVQTSWLSPAVSSPMASILRPLCGLAAAPRVLLTSVKTSSIGTSSSGPVCGRGPALSGLCRHIPCTQPSAGMKTKSALKRRCKDCFFVLRRGRLFVYCKKNPRHKQRQG